ncbi:MAG: hypothetical protein AAF721_09885 [Myxococcota bacterium]
MSGEGVDDPFPEETSRQRPVAVAVLLSVAGGLSIAGGALGRSSLKPDCVDRSDVESCATPNGADIGARSGRLFGSIGFGVGGAAFGAVGGRALGHYLRSSPDRSGRPRKIAVGVGSAAVALGSVAVIGGSVLFGINARRASELGRTFDGVTEPLSPEELSRLGTTLDHVDRARTGLMFLVAAPTFVATGIALLVTAPPAVTVSPTVSRTAAGLSLSGRF